MEKQEVESPAAWRPEPGKTAWYVDHLGEVSVHEYHVLNVGEVGTLGMMVEIGNPEDHPMNWLQMPVKYVFPTAEAALASIKIYDLNGVEVPRQQPVFEAGAAEKLLLSWMEVFDTIVQTFKDYRTGKIKPEEFDAYIDSSIATSDRLHSKALAIHDFMVRDGENHSRKGGQKVAANYNWTDAGTPQGRERLKELLDSGTEVVTAYAPHGTESPTSTMMSYLHAGKYKIQGFWFGSLPDLETLESLFFLDPSPRLEPSELQWVEKSTSLEISRTGDWEYRAGNSGWSIWFKVNQVAFEPCAGKEAAKAAIHEWRMNHLKSMTGA